jgi:hypothetical protein
MRGFGFVPDRASGFSERKQAMNKAARLAAAGAAALALALPLGFAGPVAAQRPVFTNGPHPSGRAAIGNLPPGAFGYGVGRRPGARFRGGGHRRFGGGSGGGFGRGFFLGGLGGGLIEDPDAGRDAGFFAGPAGVQEANGGAYYDYDRAYPYDWYRGPVAREAPRAASAAAIRCDVTWVGGGVGGGAGGRGGARTPVRICRGRR